MANVVRKVEELRKESRFGIVILPNSFIVEMDLIFLSRVTQRLFITRAEYLYNEMAMEYHCISPDFRILDDGEVIPTYFIKCETVYGTNGLVSDYNIYFEEKKVNKDGSQTNKIN